MDTAEPHTHPNRRQLGLWDIVSFIIGVVVGAGIFKVPALVFDNAPGPLAAMLVWVAAGILSLIGALCYAELATTYPRQGGEYYYLTRAYGRPVGFLFGWAQLAVIFTGSIGMLAYVFADYAVQTFGRPTSDTTWLALGAVIILTLLNCLGLRIGKRTQNLLTTAKVLGLFAILAAGFFWPAPVSAAPPAFNAPPHEGSIAFAMVLVLLAYGGWNDAVYLAADMRGGRRTLGLALVLGTALVTLLYLAVNMAYVWGLGYDAARQSPAVAADLLKAAWGDAGERAISVVVMVSALAAVNGLILAGSRLYSALGVDHPVFAAMGRWHPQLGVPLIALLVQAAVACGMILLVGTTPGQQVFGSALTSIGLDEPNWEGTGGFDLLLRCTAPVFWIFFTLLALSIFVLRIKDPTIERPFRVPLYPLLPLLFCLTCAYMVHSSVMYAWTFGLLGAALLVIGLPLYWASERRAARRPRITA
jgi:APA family basic amino acid/polyamine antiporter